MTPLDSTRTARVGIPAYPDDPRSTLEPVAPTWIDRLMQRFYEVISFAEGDEPDWEGMSALFSRHARITRVTPEGIDHLDVPGFQDLVRELLEVGAFTSFYEHEIARRVDPYGGIVHVASAYETKISLRARDFLHRGVNSLQLIVESGEWKILSLCWDEHAPFQGVAT